MNRWIEGCYSSKSRTEESGRGRFGLNGKPKLLRLRLFPFCGRSLPRQYVEPNSILTLALQWAGQNAAHTVVTG